MIEQIQDILNSQGFLRHGWSRLENPISLDIYKKWLEEGLHGEMDYLSRHLPFKENPQLLLKNARSAISVAQDYLPHPKPVETVSGLKVALYAQGEDYHYWFKERLNQIALRLKEIFPQEEFFCSTDSAPVLERDLAYRSGLGWIGKNTCLIDEKAGSLFFVGQILTTLDLVTEVDPHADRCGTCTRCIDACPTGALIEPRKLDARKCISYLTIESKQIPSQELSKQIGDQYFGCDICQTVCPWNQKVFGTKLKSTSLPKEQTVNDLRKILTLSGSQIEKMFRGTPLSRGSPKRHRANAIVVATNLKLTELVPEITALSKDEFLAPLCNWALTQINI